VPGGRSFTQEGYRIRNAFDDLFCLADAAEIGAVMQAAEAM